MNGTIEAADGSTAAVTLSQHFDLHGAVLDAVVAAVMPRYLARRHTLFGEGDEGSSLYIVQSGTLKLTRTTDAGRTTILGIVGAGQVLGEMSLLDHHPRTATVTALTAATLLELEQHHFDRLLTDYPASAALLLRHLGRRLRRSNDVVADLVFADVPTRVARLALRLADQFGVDDGHGRIVVDHSLTQEELAQLVGSARETVNKALASFAARGWLELCQRGFVVHASERLRSFAC